MQQSANRTTPLVSSASTTARRREAPRTQRLLTRTNLTREESIFTTESDHEYRKHSYHNLDTDNLSLLVTLGTTICGAILFFTLLDTTREAAQVFTTDTNINTAWFDSWGTPLDNLLLKTAQFTDGLQKTLANPAGYHSLKALLALFTLDGLGQLTAEGIKRYQVAKYDQLHNHFFKQILLHLDKFTKPAAKLAAIIAAYHFMNSVADSPSFAEL